MQFIYRWLNLFTDVPQVQMSVKRRAYLDWIMHVKVTRKNIYLPFYLSQIIRSNTYGSLIIRLSVLSIFLTILSHSHIISLYIASLFMFLLLLQLVPLYKEIDYILWPHIYPVSKMIRKQNLQKVLLMVGIFYILINSLCSIVYGVKTMGLMCLMLFVILMIFNFVYLPYHLSKKK